MSLFLYAGPSSPNCLTANDQTACGYHCLAAHGTVACAQTTAGVCAAVGNTVACWDPPDVVRAHYGDQVPRPQCRYAGGNFACGYHCTIQDDQVACASTPDGVCQTTYRGITCWDPPTNDYCSADQNPLPRASCIANDGDIACGYSCIEHSGQVACAQNPGGTCKVVRDQISCWDPGVAYCGSSAPTTATR